MNILVFTNSEQRFEVIVDNLQQLPHKFRTELINNSDNHNVEFLEKFDLMLVDRQLFLKDINSVVTNINYNCINKPLIIFEITESNCIKAKFISSKYLDLMSLQDYLLFDQVMVKAVEEEEQEFFLNSEKELKREKEKFQDLFENANDIIWTSDLNGHYLSVNRQFLNILGYPKPQLIGAQSLKLIAPEDRELSKQYYHRVVEGQQVEYECSVLTKNNTRKILWLKLRPILQNSSVSAIHGMGRDITERRRIQEAQNLLYRISSKVLSINDIRTLIAQIKEELSLVMSTKNFFIALYNHHQDQISLTYISDEHDDIETFPAGKTLTAYVIRNERSLLVNRDQIHALENQNVISTIGTPCKVWLGVPLKSRGEVVGAVVVQSYDDENAYTEREKKLLEFISDQLGLALDRTKYQQQLEKSEQQYRELVENLQEGLVIADIDDNIVFCNPAFAGIIGYHREELLGKNIRDLIPPSEYEKIEKGNEERRKGITSKYEIKVVDKQNQLKHILLYASPWYDHEGNYNGSLGLQLDITEQKIMEKEKIKLQEQLLQVQKMEAIGTLAGGIAHDFNNILTVIKGYTETMMQECEQDSVAYHDLEEIFKASERAASLTKKLLLFSKKQVKSFRQLNLNDLIERSLTMIKRMIGEDIRIHTDLKQNLGFIHADPSNLEQVLFNLCINARDAMPEGGEIKITTSSIEVMNYQDKKNNHKTAPGNYVLLTVEDNGSGINSKVIPHIFEPFFTTKKIDKGTGLGLAVVYGIVKQHQGWIEVDSKPGQGSKFMIYLPLSDRKKIKQIDIQKQSEIVPGNQENILLVEDSEGLREFLIKFLTKNNYKITSAENAAKALSIIQHQPESFDLMLTDVILPDRNGVKLAEEVIGICPHIKIIFSSGYTGEKSSLDKINELNYPFIRKPYKTADLLQLISKVLNN
ncbi:MAG: PAS domain S-box protein [bacterium]